MKLLLKQTLMLILLSATASYADGIKVLSSQEELSCWKTEGRAADGELSFLIVVLDKNRLAWKVTEIFRPMMTQTLIFKAPAGKVELLKNLHIGLSYAPTDCKNLDRATDLTDFFAS